VFPYEYLTSKDVLQEDRLPPIECFNSSLGKGRVISMEDYKHAQNVWKTFRCISFKDYMEIYVQLGCINSFMIMSNHII
jgi:hypothetical protein